jgi:uncharacterized protein (DUF2147 family)
MLLLCATFCRLHAQNPQDRIVGTWLADDGKAKFDIYKNGLLYNGKVAWLADSLDEKGLPKTDKRNPDESLRDKPVVGMDIFAGLKFNNGLWEGTNIYSPERGMSATLRVKLESDSVLKIIASKGFITVTKIWKKI